MMRDTLRKSKVLSANVLLIPVLLTVTGWPSTLDASEDSSKPKVAVMPIQNESEKLDKSTIEKGTSYLRGGIAASERFVVVATGRQNEKLEELIRSKKKESYKKCYDEACQVEVGKALAADTILRTKVSNFGGCILNAELIDLAKEASIAGTQQKFVCSSTSAFQDAIDHALKELVGPSSKIVGGEQRKWEGRIGGTGTGWAPKKSKRVVVSFSSKPEDAVVFVDGELLCQSTPCSKSLSGGRHKFSMKKENFLERTQRVRVKDDLELNWSLKPDFGTVSIATNPAKTPIFIDGKEMGESPLKNLRLPPGPHKAVAKHECYSNTVQRISLERGEEKVLNLTPEPLPSGIEVSAEGIAGNAIKATVYVDGEKLGSTPGRWKVPVCSERLTVKNKNGAEVQKALELSVRNVSSIRVSMENSDDLKLKLKERCKSGNSNACSTLSNINESTKQYKSNDKRSVNSESNTTQLNIKSKLKTVAGYFSFGGGALLNKAAIDLGLNFGRAFTKGPRHRLDVRFDLGLLKGAQGDNEPPSSKECTDETDEAEEHAQKIDCATTVLLGSLNSRFHLFLSERFGVTGFGGIGVGSLEAIRNEKVLDYTTGIYRGGVGFVFGEGSMILELSLFRSLGSRAEKFQYTGLRLLLGRLGE